MTGCGIPTDTVCEHVGIIAYVFLAGALLFIMYVVIPFMDFLYDKYRQWRENREHKKRDIKGIG